MRLKSLLALLVAALVGLTACVSRETAGMATGGVLGGVAGSKVGEGKGRTAATIVGAIAGAAIGGSIGRAMDERDRDRTATALETGRVGEPTTWRNPDTGNQYRVVPTRTYTQSGQPCRDYTMDVVIDGRPEQVQGTACRREDGNWHVVG
jgi:surface antigen